jgi:XRE family aerobic/anaerobic benzoate catabolism transcriptional regulator
MQRVRAQGDVRPMEGNPAAMTQLKNLLDTRTPLYERADAQINTSNRPVKASLKDLLRIIEKRHFLGALDG